MSDNLSPKQFGEFVPDPDHFDNPRNGGGYKWIRPPNKPHRHRPDKLAAGRAVRATQEFRPTDSPSAN